MSPLDAPVPAPRTAPQYTVPGTPLRSDLQLIADMVEPGSRVLDIGCSDGALLEYLARERSVTARGMELSQKNVNACVARGLSVIQGDADTDLAEYPAGAFDYAILSLTLQATREPRKVLEQMARIGRHAIVSFPNFGHWRVRLNLLLHGRMPVTEELPGPWYETPNIHLCTVKDFISLTRACGIAIEEALVLNGQHHRASHNSPWLANLFGQKAIFRLKQA